MNRLKFVGVECVAARSIDADQRGVVGRPLRCEPARSRFDPGQLLQQVHALLPEFVFARIGKVWLRQRRIDGGDARIEFAAQQFAARIRHAFVAGEGNECFKLGGLRFQLLQRVHRCIRRR